MRGGLVSGLRRAGGCGESLSPTILPRRLPLMTLPAQPLPVPLIPEQVRPVARRLNVVQFGRLCCATVPQALGAEPVQRV